MTNRLLAALLLAATLPLHAVADPFDIRLLCANDPVRCAQLQEKALALKARCDNTPDQCAELKQKLSDKAAEFKAQCDADPEACEAKKQQMMERLNLNAEPQPQ